MPASAQGKPYRPPLGRIYVSPMQLTRFTDNALRCLIVLGLEPDTCVPVPEIAERMNMSYDHLVKIVQRLATLGYVETERGRSGGVRLAVPPADVNLGALVRQTEGNLGLVECFTTEVHTCPIAPSCRLAGVFTDALQAFLAVLDGRTLEDVLKPRRELRQLLRQSAEASS